METDEQQVVFLIDNTPLTRAETENVLPVVPLPTNTGFSPEEPVYLFITEEEGIRNPAPATRGAQVEAFNASFHFGVSEFSAGGTAVSSFQNICPIHESAAAGTELFNSGKSWESDALTGSLYGFYAYAPFATSSNGITLLSGNKTIRYEMSGLSAADQPDLMTAHSSSSYVETVPLSFQHRLCAVRIVLGTDWISGFKITGVHFGNIITEGTLSIDADKASAWNSLGNRTDYSVSGFSQADGAGNVVAGGTATYLMMVPQSLSDCTLTVTLTDGKGTSHTLSASITGSWTAGKTVTYTLRPRGITSMTAVYPQWTDGGSGASYGPVSSYDVGSDVFGLYAVKTDGTIVHNNLPVGVKSVSGQTATLDLPEAFYSQSYRYFLYYPYKSSPGTVTSSATTAEAFFSGLIGGWNVSDTQNTLSAFKAQDLQVGMLSETSFTMSHRMGLAKITPASKNVPSFLTYTYGSGNPVASGEQRSIVATSLLSGDTALRILHVAHNQLWTVVKATGPDACESVYLESDKTPKDSWTLTLSGIGYGKFRNFEVKSHRESTNYIMKLPYCGSLQTVTIPWSGNFKLEVWGAQGCTLHAPIPTDSGGTDYVGGYGAYSVGMVNLEENTKLYVMVGQQGTGGLMDGSVYSAYPNGGGASGTNPDVHTGAGGGSTHIALVDSYPKDMASNYSTALLIMAGGGGSGTYSFNGDSWRGHGGAGGGVNGYDGTCLHGGFTGGGGASQTAGGISGGATTSAGGGFGRGGGGGSHAGGGGGFYGGGGAWGSAGGGGSGYIGNSLLKDIDRNQKKHMASYFNPPEGSTDKGKISDLDATRTIATKSASANPEADKAKIGHGYAIITSM